MLHATVVSFASENADLTDKGLAFEKFVLSGFNPSQFRLLDTRAASMYPLSAHDPHLAYQVQNKKANFAIECRFRESDYRHKFTWAETYQLSYYQRFQQKTQMPLYVVIGIGGLPSKPTHVYIIPFNTISNTTTLELSQFRENERANANSEFIFDAVSGKLI